MGGRPVAMASFGNGGVMVVCEDGSAWYMMAPHGVWFRQMPVPGVPELVAPAQQPPDAGGAAPEPLSAAESPGGWTRQPPFPIPDGIPDDKLPPGVVRLPRGKTEG